MYRYLTLLIICLAIVFPVFGQNQSGYPLPNNLATITAANSRQIKELARLGSALPGQVIWSPDGRWLAVGTTEQTFVYDVLDLSIPPRLVAGDRAISFTPDGYLFSDGQYWDIQTGNTITLPSPTQPISLSPSGKWEAVPNIERETVTVTIRDALDETAVAAVIASEYASEFYSAVFSPDEQVLALLLGYMDSGYIQPYVELWNLASSTLIASHALGYEKVVYAGFSEDGQQLLVATQLLNNEGLTPPGEVTLWGVVTGAHRHSWTVSHLPVQFSADKQIIAFASGGDIALWDGIKMTILRYDTGPDSSGLSAVLLSPDGNTLAGRIEYGGVALWNLETALQAGKPHLILEGTRPITHLTFDPTGAFLATLEENGIVRLWDVHTGKQRFMLEGASSLDAFSPDGTRLLVNSLNGSRQIWEVMTGKLEQTLPGFAILNPDWTYAAYRVDATVTVIQLKTGDETHFQVIEDYLGYPIALNAASGQIIFTDDLDANLRFYDLYTGQQLFPDTVLRDIRPVFSQDGSHFTTLLKNPDTTSNTIQVWRTNQLHEPLTTFAVGSFSYPQLSSDGRLLALLNNGTDASEEQLWDAENGSLLTTWIAADKDSRYTTSHTFSPDGSLLATGSIFTANLWDVDAVLEYATESNTGAVVLTPLATVQFFAPYVEIRQLAFSPDGKLLAITIFIYPLEAPDEYGEYITVLCRTSDILGQEGGIAAWQVQDLCPMISDARSLVFSPDSHLLTTYDGTSISLWDLRAVMNSEPSVLTTLPKSANVQDFVFNPDGTLLFVRDTGGVHVWGVSDN